MEFCFVLFVCLFCLFVVVGCLFFGGGGGWGVLKNLNICRNKDGSII